MNKRDLAFIVSHIDTIRTDQAHQFDSINRRLDRIEARLDTVIDTLAAHIADPHAHGQDS